MRRRDIALLACLWYGCGLIGSGFVVAEADERYRQFGLWSDQQIAENHRNNIGFGVGWALGGPCSLMIGFFSTGFGQYGWWDYQW